MSTKTTTPVLSPEDKKAAAAAKRARTVFVKKATATLDGADGQRVTVSLLDADPITGKVSQAADKDGERRWKIGSRIVSIGRIEAVAVNEAPESVPATTPDVPADQPVVADDAPAAPARSRAVEKFPFSAKPLPVALGEYVAAHASDEPTAPEDGLPFVQRGRLYLQLEGRAPGMDLLQFLRGIQTDPVPDKTAVRDQLIDLGFSRKPFSYVQRSGRQTGASYYSAPVDALGLDVVPATRRHRERAARTSAVTNPSVSRIIASATLPVRPEGTPEQKDRLAELEAEYEAARAAWRAATGAKDAAGAAAAKERVQHTKDVWIAYRREMVGAPAAEVAAA